MKKIYIAAALLLPAALASAQNLDPTVEVTTAYQAGQIEVNKPMIEMAVPDTVTQFRIDFDYSVTSNPYRGSYSFTPYALDIRPVSPAEKSGIFFLRVGAGYSLHPTADLVFTPRLKSDSFALTVYGTHRSYFGKYRSLSAVTDGDKTKIKWDKDAGKDRFSGYNSYTNAGIYGRKDWETGYFLFDAGYTGYARRDTSLRRGYDAVRARLKVASRNDARKYFYYDIDLSYMYGEDKVTPRGTANPVPYADGKASLSGHDLSLKISVGPVFSHAERLIFDINLDAASYGSYLSSYSGMFGINPKYIVRSGRWFLNLGARVSAFVNDDDTEWPESSYKAASMHKTDGQFVYPDVEIAFDAVEKHLNIYAKATGGNEINRYSSLVGRNPFLSLNYAWNYAGMPLMDNTVERVNGSLGLRGSIGSRFSFDIYGGYARYNGLLLDAVVSGTGSVTDAATGGSGLQPTVSYAEYCDKWYAALQMGWHSRDVDAKAFLAYTSTDVVDSEEIGFEPAPFAAGLDVSYTWKNRVTIGLNCECATARDGYSAVMETLTSDLTGESVTSLTRGPLYRIPGWFDLGLSAEYRFSSKLSFWIYGSNLLNQTIQRSPLYCTSGIAATAGIALTL